MLLTAAAVPAAAQEAPADTACTYETCALRATGSAIVRGRQEDVVTSRGPLDFPGLFGYDPDLTHVVSCSPAAVNNAAEYERLQRPILLSFLGTAVLLGLALEDGVHGGIRTGAAVGGIGLYVRNSRLSQRASRSFSRALWEYNASLCEP